jgi:adenine-specific DNA-methyltransferase
MPDPATHPRVPQELSQPITENLQKLAALFPSAVKDGALDMEALREELGEFEEIRPGDEKYELNWVGKQAAKKEAFAPLLGKTLAFKPEESKDPANTENLYIEGDNLEALKLLRQNYYGEVKMIYIDPPYNTGKDFVYRDKFKISEEESEEEEGAVSAEGKRLIKNEKSSNRFHARWLDMMYPRLRLAKDLLREDGVIFISIDDNEVAALQKICEEVFRSENFIACLPTVMNLKGNNDEFGFAGTHEYTLSFCKNKSLVNLFEFTLSDEDLDEWNEDEYGLYKQGANLKATGQNAPRERRPNLWFPLHITSDDQVSITVPEDNHDVVWPITNNQEMSWRWSRSKFQESLSDLIINRGGDSISVYKKQRPNLGELPSKKPKSLFYKPEYSSGNGTAELKLLFGKKLFDAPPKPLCLLRDLIEISTRSHDLILDFFSGSATTAHSVMLLNAEDGGKRRHIMVQLPEICDENSEAAKADYKTIAEIGRERIRRAGERIKQDLRAKAATATTEEKAAKPYLADPDSLDIGFKAFLIEDTKINWIRKDLKGEEISFQGMGNQDALDFVPGFTDEDIVYEVMLRQSNIPLTQAITKPVPGANGKRTYLYGESYLICLEETVTKELIETLAALEPTPLKYFFRDSAFGKDIALKDETFRRLNAEIAKNHGDQGTAYTVEFI